MGTNLPLDVILAILVRLPVKSLQRFKCVCKEWFNLINDPLFIKLHLQKFNDSSGSKPASIACLHNNNVRLYLQDDRDLGSLSSQPTEINELPPLVHEKKRLVGSCNSLLCFSNYKDGNFIDICNPSTGFFKKIIFPREVLGTNKYVRGFGYDCENDDYKIVLMEWPRGKDMFVYSLKQNLWMQHSSLTNSTAFSGYFCTWDALFMNKRLHWAVLTGNRAQIARFNLCSERWEELISPITPIEYIHKLAILDGCLCLCSSKHSITDIWIMKEYGVKESWTKLASVPCVAKPFGPLRVAPIRYSKSKSKLLFSSYNGARLFWYDMKKKIFTEVQQTIPVKIEDLSTCLPYARSLVSIP